jgi:hypothetical protein
MACSVCCLPWPIVYLGACYRCNAMRLAAARTFVAAADAVRLARLLGAEPRTGHKRPPTGHDVLERAVLRVDYADQQCVRLGMWSAARSTRRPPWFYGDERSNTR